MSTTFEIPTGFERRPVVPDAADSISAIINAAMLAEIGEPWTSPDRTRDELTAPGVDLANDHVLVVTSDGEPAAYLSVEAGGDPLDEVSALVFVHPASLSRGLSTHLLGVAERRARELVRDAGVSSVPLLAARASDNDAAARLFSALAYTPVRTFHMMRMALDAPIHEPVLPDGVAIRTFDADRDARAVWDTMTEAFADHWGSEAWTFERWRHIEVDGADLDPSAWFLAVEGEEVAGIALCSPTSPRRRDTAVVKELAVRRAWRRRGLGLALLLTAFRTFADRGIAHVELGVDAENLTGATRLYERAGMAPAFSWEWWSKAVTV